MNKELYQAIVAGNNSVNVTLSAADLRNIVSEMMHAERVRIDSEIRRHREKPALTRKQVSKILDKSITTLIAWDKMGILKPVRIGSRVMYRPTDIDKLLTNNN